MRIPAVVLVLLVASCHTSFQARGGTDAGADTAADPGHDAPATCSTDGDCVIALHEDRCCSPDPVAVPRSALSDPCLHEMGTAWAGSPDCVRAPCAACQPIEERFYAARCVDGTCTGVTDFCAPMVSPEPAARLESYSPPAGGWASYRGQLVTVTGFSRLGPGSCECCEECDCTCFDSEVQITLDCEIAVRGSACGAPWECGGTECDPSCSPYDPRTSPSIEVVQGWLVDSELEGFEIWAMGSAGDCPPPGPNPEGEPCNALEDGGGCADGLHCFYWGDTIFACDGTCRPWGEECDTDPDCPPDDVCYMGYCVWCCPG